MRTQLAFVTYALAAVTAVCTVVAWAVPIASDMASGLALGLPEPVIAFASFLQPVSAESGVWTLLTYMLVHGSVPHLVCNLFSLAYLGVVVERIYGHTRMLVAYVASGIVGGVFFQTMSSGGSCVGASGAVFGVMAMYAALLVSELASREPLFMEKRRAASLMMGFVSVLAVNVFVSFMPGIAWQAHLGGALAGFAIGLVMLWQMRSRAKADLEFANRGHRYQTGHFNDRY